MNQVLFKNTMIPFLVVALALLTPTIESSKPAINEEDGANALRPAPSVSSLFPKTHVYFHNQLGNGLTVAFHPRSHYWDFGLRQLADGHTGEITFHPFLIPKLTDIRCDFSKQNGTAIVGVYKYSRDHKRCYKNCHWNILPQGINGINKKGVADIFVKWWPAHHPSKL